MIITYKRYLIFWLNIWQYKSNNNSIIIIWFEGIQYSFDSKYDKTRHKSSLKKRKDIYINLWIDLFSSILIICLVDIFSYFSPWNSQFYAVRIYRPFREMKHWMQQRFIFNLLCSCKHTGWKLWFCFIVH